MAMRKVRIYTIILCLLALTTMVTAQPSPATKLSLQDLSGFRPQAGNWQIVGDVQMDPFMDFHPPQPADVPERSKGNKKKKEAPDETGQPVRFKPGTGILLNINDDNRKSHLVTTWEHGDIELELEVMLPKGSNSGIYLQGRYELQLFDSWSVRDPSFADMGGIYRNWETAQDSIYPGKAPLSNPSKAPGLWQTLRISFRAPKFDAAGKKTANAKFVFVELNGVIIHDNIEVPWPTGGPIEKNESPMGPLMIQGDHGPVAFRNIQYKLMRDVPISLGPLSYKAYQGRFKTIDEITAAKPFATGTIPELTYEVVNAEDTYAAIFTSTITVPEDNTYEFELSYSGGARLTVNGQQLIDYQRPDAERSDKGTLYLKAGTYPIEIYNYKDVSWEPPKLALFVKTANSHPYAFHTFNSFPPEEDPVSSIFIKPGNTPRLLRAFIDFEGDRNKRLTHTIGVGDPRGIHYVYDLKSGNIVCVWRGNFVDATPMWHDRGDGSFLPRGAVQYLFRSQPLAFLDDKSKPFPLLSHEDKAMGKGYDIDEATARPLFNYAYEGIEVQDKIYPDEDNRILIHEITLKERGTKQGLYYKLAEGSSVTIIKDGLYTIDQKYYIQVPDGLPATVRQVNGKQELIAPVDQNSIKYSIIW